MAHWKNRLLQIALLGVLGVGLQPVARGAVACEPDEWESECLSCEGAICQLEEHWCEWYEGGTWDGECEWNSGTNTCDITGGCNIPPM